MNSKLTIPHINKLKNLKLNIFNFGLIKYLKVQNALDLDTNKRLRL